MGRADHRTDAALLAGDAEDLGAFYERHERAVLGFLVHRVRDPHLAAELCAETFAEVVVQRRARGTLVREPRAWLYAIARSKLADHRRHGRVDDSARRRIGLTPLSFDDAALARVEALGADPVLADALGALRADERDAVVRRVIGDESYAAIAARQGTTEPAARKRVSRALARLRRNLEGGTR